MAAKKNVVATQKEPDALIIDKASFTTKLLARIELGKELLNRSVTNEAELNANDSDFHKWNSYNAEFLKQSFNNEDSQYMYQYDRVNYYVGMLASDRTANEKLRRLKEYIGNKVEYLENLLDKVELLKSDVEEHQPAKPSVTSVHKHNQNIFVVHGHNTAVQQKVARTLEKLKLTPIILHEQPNTGKTIIEKFESNSNVGFAIVLLTDDDEGKAKMDVELKNRARQNVVLELGYFIGKLGRDRVLPLYSEGVEIPSDIHGLLYTPIDKAETWKFALVKELKAAGYSVDANDIL